MKVAISSNTLIGRNNKEVVVNVRGIIYRLTPVCEIEEKTMRKDFEFLDENYDTHLLTRGSIE